jgi:signal peptidase complex subunit 3
MHNVMVRLNAVVFFALTVLLVLAIMCFLSSWFHTGEPKMKVMRLEGVTKMNSIGGQDKAYLKFHLSADLAPAFHWNIKQLFVFVVAEYKTETHDLNQVIIWDRIIERKEDATFKLKSETLKYALSSQGADLRDREVTLKLMWDHMPLTGRLYMATDPRNSTFTTPAELTQSTTGRSKTRR